MMAGLPEEARDKVIDQSTDDACCYWLCSSYYEYYNIHSFQTNPDLAGFNWNYARCLDLIDISDMVPMLDSLIAGRKDG